MLGILWTLNGLPLQREPLVRLPVRRRGNDETRVLDQIGIKTLNRDPGGDNPVCLPADGTEVKST